jgi:hypothetical protein
MEDMMQFTVRMERDDAEWLSEEAKKWGFDRSSFLRFIVKRHRYPSRTKQFHTTEDVVIDFTGENINTTYEFVDPKPEDN